MAEEKGLTIDEEDLEKQEKQFREESRGVDNSSGPQMTLDLFSVEQLMKMEIAVTNDEAKYDYSKNASGKY
eukprot:Awhi_evm1s4150